MVITRDKCRLGNDLHSTELLPKAWSIEMGGPIFWEKHGTDAGICYAPIQKCWSSAETIWRSQGEARLLGWLCYQDVFSTVLQERCLQIMPR